MKYIVKLFLVIAMFAVLTGCSVLPERYADSYNQNIDLTGITDLTALTENGDIEITRNNQSGNTCIMTVIRSVEGGSEYQNRQFCQTMTVNINTAGGLLSLVSNHPTLQSPIKSVSISIVLSIPQNLISSFQSTTTNGNLKFVNLNSTIVGSTQNGNITVQGAGAYTLNSNTGNITLNQTRLTGVSGVMTGSGNITADIKVEAVGIYTFRSINGNVEVRIPQSTSSAFDMVNNNGSTSTYGLTFTSISSSAHHIFGTLNGNNGTTRLNMSTGNGNLKLALSAYF